MNKETPILIPAYVKPEHKAKVRKQLGFDTKLVLTRVDLDSLPRGNASQLNSTVTHRHEQQPRPYIRRETDSFTRTSVQSDSGPRHH